MSTQPAALRYAEVLENFCLGIGRMDATGAAAELRRLHAANVDCVEHFNALKAERDELLAALRIFVGAACPVSTDIDPRGHSWSEAYLDQALDFGHKAIQKVSS